MRLWGRGRGQGETFRIKGLKGCAPTKLARPLLEIRSGNGVVCRMNSEESLGGDVS